ncbi:MAG TPA: YheU family protein [Steroidobacteraceae bacterium]|nr:YheU family protein [Steroidobacteraceae bacterium]
MSDDTNAPPGPPVEVSYKDLSAGALQGVIESYVLREGTDYGERDVPFESKVAQVRRQLENGEATIVFDPESESIDIVPVSGTRMRR